MRHFVTVLTVVSVGAALFAEPGDALAQSAPKPACHAEVKFDREPIPGGIEHGVKVTCGRDSKVYGFKAVMKGDVLHLDLRDTEIHRRKMQEEDPLQCTVGGPPFTDSAIFTCSAKDVDHRAVPLTVKLSLKQTNCVVHLWYAGEGHQAGPWALVSLKEKN
jgi:hypothetical protein